MNYVVAVKKHYMVTGVLSEQMTLFCFDIINVMFNIVLNIKK